MSIRQWKEAIQDKKLKRILRSLEPFRNHDFIPEQVRIRKYINRVRT